VCKPLKQDDDDDDDNNNNNKGKRSAGLEEEWFCVEMTSGYSGSQQVRASQRITNMPLYSNKGMQILTSDCHG